MLVNDVTVDMSKFDYKVWYSSILESRINEILNCDVFPSPKVVPCLFVVNAEQWFQFLVCFFFVRRRPTIGMCLLFYGFGLHV